MLPLGSILEPLSANGNRAKCFFIGVMAEGLWWKACVFLLGKRSDSPSG